MLLPEVDMEKATKLQFVNSDKPAIDATLGTDPRTIDIAYAISLHADKIAFASQK